MMEPNQGRGRNQWNPSTRLANTLPPNPLHNTQADNIAITNTNTGNTTPDPFYDPFGDHFQITKPTNTFQVALQNFGGWPQWASHEKKNNIRSCCADCQIDVLVTTENNVAWHWILATQ